MTRGRLTDRGLVLTNGWGRRLGGAKLALALVALTYTTLAVAAFVDEEMSGAADWPLRHDQVGYYAYLPALLTDGGWTFDDFVGARWDRFEASGFRGFPRNQVTGRRVNVYTPGVAVLQAPFFVVGHLAARVAGTRRDGFSWPYRLLACLGAVVYAVLGLFFVFALLRRHFPEWAAAGVVVSIGLGTNLLYYSTIEPLMSHAYSFFVFSLVTWATLAWSETDDMRHWLALGAGLGLAVLIRPTNAVLAVLPLLFLVRRGAAAGFRWSEGQHRRRLFRQVLATTAAGAAVTLPLLAYWRFASGSWIHNPHGPGTFYLSEPAISSVLFSYRKGWFVYAPVMFSVVPGLFLLRRYVSGITLPLIVYASVNLYIVSSWWNWWYGGGFGMRALIESSAPLALAMGAVIAAAGSTARRRRAV